MRRTGWPVADRRPTTPQDEMLHAHYKAVGEDFQTEGTTMHPELRTPLWSVPAHETEDAVIAALSAEVVWLCRSGELDRLYEVYPCFMTRTAALDRIMRGQRLDAMARKFEGRQVRLVAACHDHGCSLVLQVMDRKGRPTPAADALISIRLREGVTPDGRPLSDGPQPA